MLPLSGKKFWKGAGGMGGGGGGWAGGEVRKLCGWFGNLERS